MKMYTKLIFLNKQMNKYIPANAMNFLTEEIEPVARFILSTYKKTNTEQEYNTTLLLIMRMIKMGTSSREKMFCKKENILREPGNLN